MTFRHLIALFVGLAACQRVEPAADRPGPDVREALAREFAGAYPADEPAPTDTVVHRIVAAPTRLELLDGRSLDVWAYNGQVPGPILHVRLGQRLRVEFENRLPQPTTIHWHGVRLPNAMDGVPGVTQPPVPPGGSFTYEFTPKDAGTFWFHPHIRSSEQVERGLYGVLVVEDVAPPPYSQDVVWVLDDWKLTRDGAEIDPAFVTRHDLAHDGRWGQVSTVNGRTDHETIVRPGERIRLRLLNAANGRVFAPDLGDLDARVIAVDGMYTARPLDPAGFELAPGNRLDLDIRIPADAAGGLHTIIDVFGRAPRPIAAVRVADGPVETVAFESPARARVPRWEDALGVPVDLDLSLDARRGGPYGIEWTINGEAHGEHAAHDHQEPVGRFTAGRFTRMRFTNVSPRLHPMHIHGSFFRVLARDGHEVDEPYWRDTVLVRPRQTIDVGLVPLDPGLWMLHCHILEHAEAGMMTLVEVIAGA